MAIAQSCVIHERYVSSGLRSELRGSPKSHESSNRHQRKSPNTQIHPERHRDIRVEFVKHKTSKQNLQQGDDANGNLHPENTVVKFWRRFGHSQTAVLIAPIEDNNTNDCERVTHRKCRSVNRGEADDFQQLGVLSRQVEFLGFVHFLLKPERSRPRSEHISEELIAQLHHSHWQRENVEQLQVKRELNQTTRGVPVAGAIYLSRTPICEDRNHNIVEQLHDSNLYEQHIVCVCLGDVRFTTGEEYRERIENIVDENSHHRRPGSHQL
mmetsp:Transcript_2742/g.9867  ORF Transcript_2742/g.9867 Transcript_2742/m.9867 type:complete len:268 (+) Transcript_2742:3359-4162(+)